MTQISTKTSLAIIGGGIIGLWCAQRAVRQGYSVTLFEAGQIGKNASGGILGALMPHQPIQWDSQKQMQCDGLKVLGREIAHIEDVTGIACNYAICGRIMAAMDIRHRERIAFWGKEAERIWEGFNPGERPLWQLLDSNPLPTWARNPHGEFGFSYDRISARIEPRSVMKALRHYVENQITIRENTKVTRLCGDGVVEFENGKREAFDAVVITAGYESFKLAASHDDTIEGTGVKGQALLVEPQQKINNQWPIVFDNGVYVIAHNSGLVAIGSTTQKEWQGANQCDGKLDDLFVRAQKICPALEGAKEVERWSAIRPKGPTAHPVVQRLTRDSRCIIASAGYKITFAIGHKIADKIIKILGDPVN